MFTEAAEQQTVLWCVPKKCERENVPTTIIPWHKQKRIEMLKKAEKLPAKRY